ncbi:hypothetical protein F4859DRAFT_517399 [Xylaria cf. heliscus]|nr:hypothetical protein F4859DRAFT_517399 [Xylaria cf. heliscus]
MANRLAGASCLSAEPHEHNITNPLLHFLGCIEICERDNFLNGNIPIWEDELEYQREEHVDAEEVVKKMKRSWTSSCRKELRRIALLRYALSKDNHDKQLVKEVTSSGRLWRNSSEYKSNIGKVKQWRQYELGKSNSVTGPDSTHGMDDYELEKDISVPIIQFKGCQEFTDDNLSGKFPNQKTTIKILLDDSDPTANLLHKDRNSGPGCIKYIHIPSNNMEWAEEAIARYYGEKKPDFGAMQRHLRRPRKTSTYMILQDRYWRGQLHGDPSSPPHARYMSSMCETVLSLGKPDGGPKNIVLFMPYLHWETSKRQEQIASEIDKIVIQTAKDLDDSEADAKRQRQETRQSLLLLEGVGPKIENPQQRRYNGQPKEFEEVVEDAMHEYGKFKTRLFKSRNALGCYLLAAAHLYEGMSTYRDRMLLRKYLPKNPPIHPRRTLDQAYYWTLKSTKKRDRDQVIYRGTTATRDTFHHYDEEKREWKEHRELEGRDCSTCRTNIRKVSRVIMVDQLWMWILDEKTLITCFPKRYGANKQDYSGVHKSIRTSLENLGSDQIRTVFELALIVLSECTTSLFDRTKSLDRRPQVIDEFSMAIGKIMHKQTVAFTRLWRWTDEARKFFRSQGYMSTRNLHIPLLDINPEGRLEREIEDIIEELDIMLRISNTYQDTVKSFVEQVEHILDPDGDFRNKFERVSSRFPSAKQATQKQYEDYQSFKIRANECKDRVNGYVKDLESLRKSAKNTAEDVLHLLTMKQQQASVVQAWQAVKQSDETIKQGRSIMVFTLATIVFLPLSFLTSVFGMNNFEFGDNNWHLKQQLLYIFLISAGVVLVSLLFAFSAWIRALIWSFYSRISTKLATRTGIYTYIAQRKHIEDIFDETYSEVDGMKTEARRQALKEKVEKRSKAVIEELKRQEGRTMKYICKILDEMHMAKGNWHRSHARTSPASSLLKVKETLGQTEWIPSFIRQRRTDSDGGPINDDPEMGTGSDRKAE